MKWKYTPCWTNATVGRSLLRYFVSAAQGLSSVFQPCSFGSKKCLFVCFSRCTALENIAALAIVKEVPRRWRWWSKPRSQNRCALPIVARAVGILLERNCQGGWSKASTNIYIAYMYNSIRKSCIVPVVLFQVPGAHDTAYQRRRCHRYCLRLKTGAASQMPVLASISRR